MQHEDQLLAQQQRQSGAVEARLLASDRQRSVLNVLDVARQHPLAYSPYGHRPAESGLLSLLGFNGERLDPVTGCYLLGNGYRAFNPVLMRFNSPDSWSPFGKGGLNGYAYCSGDPINQSDQTGHAARKLISILKSDKIPFMGSLKKLISRKTRTSRNGINTSGAIENTPRASTPPPPSYADTFPPSYESAVPVENRPAFSPTPTDFKFDAQQKLLTAIKNNQINLSQLVLDQHKNIGHSIKAPLATNSHLYRSITTGQAFKLNPTQQTKSIESLHKQLNSKQYFPSFIEELKNNSIQSINLEDLPERVRSIIRDA
ncbi:hypothetical protein D3C81_1291790 [compost metagenome]